MRKQIVAGNWKMNLDAIEAKTLVSEIINSPTSAGTGTEVIFGVPSIFLTSILDLVKGHPSFHVAAQNIHQEPNGAYTGEISANMVASVGVSHVIIGHSERRQYFGEDDALLAKKICIALEYSLTPIFCLGEDLAQRESGQTFDVVRDQLANTAFGLSAEEFSKLIIAYEPVWAIGTGKTASPEQAQEVHAYLRRLIEGKYGKKVADETSILYGGSVKPSNAAELFSCEDIDGGLVGGASLKSEDFISIIQAME